MDSVLKFNIYNDDREKIFKIVQYASHLMCALQSKMANNAETVLRLKQVELMMALSRQALRFGKFSEAFNSSIHSMRLQDNWMRTTLSLSRISYGLYLLCDNIVWLSRIGVIRCNEQRFCELAQSYLLYSSALAAVKNIYQLKLIADNHNERYGHNNNSMIQLLMMNKILAMELGKNLCDICLCLHSLDRIRLSPINVGLMGLISSLIFLLKRH
ncbi:Peroxisomal membrane protein PMP30B [Dermatophagoides pteronyssinus]|uniref:Peroxisomal membrane protein PMP30B n=1 Tax=Dermatophagoides pteronyssinus TaxID=6956 RepID=A0ABQ8J3K8_DERPT|nr:Peroxisomal membrane protein PMP30B [Dermatophagoides pteronyssinus]